MNRDTFDLPQSAPVVDCAAYTVRAQGGGFGDRSNPRDADSG